MHSIHSRAQKCTGAVVLPESEEARALCAAALADLPVKVRRSDEEKTE